MSKTVLITGASTGMGRETALRLVKEGYKVYGAARRVEQINKLEGVIAIQMDVTKEDSILSGVQQILDNESSIDILINNAGYGEYGSVEEVSLADARYQMEVNLFGAARITQLALPKMIENGYGKIINISSIGGKIASAFGGWYHASKFALEGLSDSLRNEVRQFGVDVIVIEPGGIKSEWGGVAIDKLLKVSGEGRYKPMVEKFAAMLTGVVENEAAVPSVVADVIYEAITTEQPEPRYAIGYMAKEMLELRKQHSDKEFDHLSHSQLGL